MFVVTPTVPEGHIVLSMLLDSGSDIHVAGPCWWSVLSDTSSVALVLMAQRKAKDQGS